MRSAGSWRLFVIALVGAVVGPLAELAHWRAGVWELEADAALPLWIPAVYFVTLLGAGFMFRGLERRWKNPLGSTRLSVPPELVLLVVLFSAPPLLSRWEIALTLAAAAYLGLRLITGRVKGDLLVAVTIAALDLAIEGTLVWAGLFRYTSATHGALPLWLPFLWGGLALELRRMFFILSGLPQVRD